MKSWLVHRTGHFTYISKTHLGPEVDRRFLYYLRVTRKVLGPVLYFIRDHKKELAPPNDYEWTAMEEENRFVFQLYLLTRPTYSMSQLSICI